ncbi:hypothetical protein CBR_g40944 [Chara braunii]|uniref:Vesicle transport protein n=1 Tax=Chara braunii TaxID=69332 RepID=A0A388LUX9_CHABU|nr:hypothetical protein CBR_g40944 [Chara braunii]|eukprot:GBG86043.1 hypothetical protein CBR_g40944 [Chara braunii]
MQEERPTSVLAEWKDYVEGRNRSDGGGGASGTFDLESGRDDVPPLIKSVNETIGGVFTSVTKGMRELPGNMQQAAQSMPSRKAVMYFGVMMSTGVLFLFLSFTIFLPVMALAPQKFAVSFTIGCLFVMGSFFVLKGPKQQLQHMLSMDRLPFTAAFVGSIVTTVYSSMVLHSYPLSVISSIVQVMALLYYAISYFPGGAAGMRFLASGLRSAVFKCFGC